MTSSGCEKISCRKRAKLSFCRHHVPSLISADDTAALTSGHYAYRYAMTFSFSLYHRYFFRSRAIVLAIYALIYRLIGSLLRDFARWLVDAAYIAPHELIVAFIDFRRLSRHICAVTRFFDYGERLREEICFRFSIRQHGNIHAFDFFRTKYMHVDSSLEYIFHFRHFDAFFINAHVLELWYSRGAMAAHHLAFHLLKADIAESEISLLSLHIYEWFTNMDNINGAMHLAFLSSV